MAHRRLASESEKFPSLEPIELVRRPRISKHNREIDVELRRERERERDVRFQVRDYTVFRNRELGKVSLMHKSPLISISPVYVLRGRKRSPTAHTPRICLRA